MLRVFVVRLHSHRKMLMFALASLLLMLMFQNCGEPGLNSGSSVSSSSTSPVGTTTNDGTAPLDQITPSPLTPSPDGSVLTPSGLSVEEQRNNCFSALGVPSILSLTSDGVAVTSATISSGLGSSSSGDTKTPPTFDVSVNRGIVNSTIYNLADNRCDTHLNVSVTCQVVENNPAAPTDSPLVIKSAINTAGNSLLGGTTTQLALARQSLNTNNCNATLLPGTNTTAIRIVPNTMNTRCVEGNYWVRLNVSTSITGLTGSKISEAKYLKVLVNNGCWIENRLKDSTGPLPSVVNFGTAVAAHNNWAAVVAPTDDATPTVLDVGSVYMYMYNGSQWVQKQKIMIADSAHGESLSAIAIRGDTLVIGSPYRNARGMAYFYRRTGDTWTLIQQVDPAVAGINQDFGKALALNDRYVFVGSPHYSGSLAKAGAISIYSYTSSGMNFVKSISGAVANAAFGSALAVDNTVLAVSAPQALGKESLAPGSVFIYDEAAGAFNLSTTKVGTAAAEKFGTAIAVFGKRMAVGSPNFVVGGTAGGGRVSYYNDYSLTTAPKIFSGAAGSNLGQSVALSNTGLYIGAPFANTKTGYVDHFLYKDIAAGTLYFRLLAYNSFTYSGFGYSIAATDSDVVIGARIKSDPNDNSGAAYIYRFK